MYGISVAAELVGMGVQNLRLYEARGLLEPERTDGGTRRYSQTTWTGCADRDLLDAGLNLAGIGMVLDLEEDVGGLERDSARLLAANTLAACTNAAAARPDGRPEARAGCHPSGGGVELGADAEQAHRSPVGELLQCGEGSLLMAAASRSAGPASGRACW